MATLTLTQLWINRMDTGEGYGYYTTDRGIAKSSDGEVRTYAGGRRRAITKAGVNSTFQVTVRQLTLVQKTLLESWIGLSLEIRDHRGQRWVGVFFDVKTVEWKAPPTYDCAIILTEVTYPDGV